MKKTFISFLFFALTFVLYSQERPPELQKKLDSLWSIWEDNTKADTLRLKAIDNFIEEGYLKNQPDSANYYAQIQYDFAFSKRSKMFMAHALIILGEYSVLKGDSYKGLNNFKESLKLYEEINNKKSIISVLGRLGSIYLDKGNYLQALNYFQKSLKLSESIGFKIGIATNLNDLGRLFTAQRDYSQGLNYFLQSKILYEELEFDEGLLSCYNNIGGNYLAQGEPLKALNYYNQCLKLAEEKGNKIQMNYILNNIGFLYTEIGDYSQAMNYLEEALDSSTKLDDKSTIAYTLNNIGNLYNKKNEAFKALSHCGKCLQLAKEIGDINLMKFAYDCLYQGSKKTGNTKKALEYYEQLVVLKDSMFNEENTKKITQLEMQYDFDKKEAETKAEQEKKDALAAQKLKRQKLLRNGFIGGFAVVLLFAGVFFTQRNKISKEKQRSENLLLNILPAEVAEELKEKGEAEAQDFEMVSILFSDFKGFTGMSEKMTAKDLVGNINECFKAFDGIMQKYNIEKIKTIGDAYMAAGGLPIKTSNSVKNTVLAALEMQDFIIKLHQEKEAKGEHAFEMRVGIHTGAVVAGIVGVKKFQYDIWGDTVNTASRMESSGEVGKVNISETTYNYIKNEPEFTFESRGKIQAKGKGEIQMYFVSLT